MPLALEQDDIGGKQFPQNDSAASTLHEQALADAYALPKLQQNLLVSTATVSDSGAAGLLAGLTDGAINRPIEAVKQVLNAGEQNESKRDSKVASAANGSEPESASHKLGTIIGTLAPFVGLSLLTRGASSRLFGAESPSALRLMGEQAASGFLLGSLLTPSEIQAGQNMLSSRLSQGGIMAATFATMSGSASLLNRALPEAASASIMPVLTRRIAIGALSGVAGGIVDAEGKSGFNASGSELLTSSLGYAAFGTVAEAAGTIAGRSLLHDNQFARARSAGPALEANLSPANNAAQALAADTNTTIISSHGGWYDKLSSAIRKAPPEHTIIVSDPAWLKEANQLLKESRRNDIKVLLGTAAESRATTTSESRATTTSESRAATTSDTIARTAEPPPQENKWEIRSRLVERIKQEVQSSGLDPGDAIAAALRRGRAVMVGEYHVPDSPNRLLGAKIMPQLKETGLTHLAIEQSSDSAGKIFDANGKVNRDVLAPLLQHHEFYSLLEAAKKEGIEVVPVDAAENASRDLASRNVAMDENIANILDADPANKVLYWVGNKHLQTIEEPGEGLQVAQLLRNRNLAVTTFYGRHDNFWREEPLRNLYSPNRPVAIPTANAPTLSSLNWLHPDQSGHALHHFGEFDYLLMYPEQVAAHFD